MQFEIQLSGDSRVQAHIHGHTIATDQPTRAGGDDRAPSPYALFLASIGTCAGYFVQSFCASRGLSTVGIRIVQQVEKDPATGLAGQVSLDIAVPETFPAKYHRALLRVVDQCSVKRTLAHPPVIETAISALPSRQLSSAA